MYLTWYIERKNPEGQWVRYSRRFTDREQAESEVQKLYARGDTDLRIRQDVSPHLGQGNGADRDGIGRL